MLTQKALEIYGDLGTAKLLPMISTMHLLKPKSICTTSSHRASTIEVIRPIKPIERMLKKIGILDVQKYVISVSLYIELFLSFQNRNIHIYNTNS